MQGYIGGKNEMNRYNIEKFRRKMLDKVSIDLNSYEVILDLGYKKVQFHGISESAFKGVKWR